jgi:hypothetical protein
VADLVFTLANQTGRSLSFTVQWQGSSAVESSSLMPGVTFQRETGNVTAGIRV